MHILYAKESLKEGFESSIFLAGPTPRDAHTPSWRPEALRLLKEHGFTGTVFVPEERKGEWKGGYIDQITWEQRYRAMADVIFFWVPRELQHMPAFTTNVEFGEDIPSGKAVYGRPEGAPKTRYLDVLYEQRYQESPASTLKEAILQAILRLGQGSFRQGGECYVPLHIWKTTQFQRWYRAHRAVGNELREANLQQTVFFRNSRDVFSFQLKVRVWIEAEQREKKNEFFFARPDLGIVIAWYKEEDQPISEAQVLLVREFRSPVRNVSCFVYEFPGGSEIDQTLEPHEVIVQELSEETGIVLADPSRLRYVGERQMCATLCSHTAHVFGLSLTKEEYLQTKEKAERGDVLGIPGSSERISLLFHRLDSLHELPLDWSMLGMLYGTIKEQEF